MRLFGFGRLQRNNGLKAYYSEDSDGCHVTIMDEPGWVYDDLKVRPFDYLALDSMAREVESGDFENRDDAIRETQAYLRSIGLFDEETHEEVPLDKRLFSVRYGGNPLELVFSHGPLTRKSVPSSYDDLSRTVRRETGVEFEPYPARMLDIGDHYSDPDGRFAIVRNMNTVQRRLF